MAHMSFDFYTLKNGLRVILVPMEGVESVGVGVYVGTGSRNETPRINGISHFLEHMVFKGTKKFPTHQDTSYLEGLGAVQNAWTSTDTTCYWTKIPADRWEQGLELVKELAMNPVIPEHDLEIERGVILEEINRREDRPDERVGEVLQELMFEGNPLGMTVLGEAQVIKSVTRADFLDYHSRRYVPGNAVVAIAGKLVDTASIKSRIEEWFGEWKAVDHEPTEYWNTPQDHSAVKLYSKQLAQQAHIELAVRGVTLTDPRRFALSILTSYLGQGLSSRLFTELREKRGLCYSVRAYNEPMIDTGVWSVYAGLNIDKLDSAVEAILGEMKRATEVELTEKELEAAKEKLRGPLLFSAENPINQMDFYAKQALERPDDVITYDQLVSRLMQTDSKQITSVARDLFVADKLNLAVVGPLGDADKVRLEKKLVLQ